MSTEQTTRITRQDLKFYPSERLTDNDDGGGMPLGTPISGEANAVFNPISSIARVNGGFYARLIYAGVLRDDDEPLIGAFAAITKPPNDPTVSYLLFPATKFGELRSEILKRIESFAIRTIESRMTLLSTQSQGSRIIQAYQRPGEPLPVVGDVFCLHQNKAGYTSHEQYVKVVRVESEDRTFYNSNTQKDFKRTIIKMEISQRLDNDFIGADYPSERYIDTPCKIRETHIADSAQYYGIKPLASAISKNDMRLQIADLKEKLVPTSQVETQLVDLTAAGERSLLFDGAKDGDDGSLRLSLNINANKNTVIYLSNSILPGSIEVSLTAGVATDNGGQLKIADNVVATVDYVSGNITFTTNIYIYSVKFRPSANDLKIADTAAISVTQQNRSYNYLMTISPPPAPGSLIVSYRSGGKWYDLRDDGSGNLRGLSVAHGSGNVNFVSGTVAITCGEMPDVGSDILYMWGNRASYFNRSNLTASAQLVINLEQQPAPGTINLAWIDKSKSKTATDDGAGKLTGDWLGIIDYLNQQIIIDITDEFVHTTDISDVTVTYSTGPALTKQFVAPLRDSTGTITLDLQQTQIKPGTYRQRWNLLIEDYDTSIQAGDSFFRKFVDPYKTVTDDRAGKLVDIAGNEYGTIDYTAGTVTFNPDTTVQIPKAKYKKIAMGERVIKQVDGGEIVQPLHRNVFDGYEYFDAGASMPINESGLVECWFRGEQTIDAVEEVHNTGDVQIKLPIKFSERILPNSLNFDWGENNYFDRRGELYYKLDNKTGSAQQVGSIDYNTGVLLVKNWKLADKTRIPNLRSCATTIDGNPIDEVTFRAPSAPLRPSSFQLVATKTTGGQINVRSNTDGSIKNADAEGYIDYEHGVVRVRFGRLVDAQGKEDESWYNPDAVDENGKIWQAEFVFAETITYSTVAYSYLPVDSSIVKIDTVRLPQDGRVPVFRRGDTILISNNQTDDIGSAHTSGQTVQLSRTDVDRICITDADGKAVNAALWDYDLDAGTITWTTRLDLSSYKMPLSVMHTQEQRNRIVQADIDGTLSLQFPTNRDYTLENTYVSSVLIGGDLTVRHSIPFTQRNWQNIWRDSPAGEQLLNKLNLKDYPMVLTDDGAIKERWLIKFKTASTYELYGETLGFVGRYDTLSDLAPINPATNKPYFTIPRQAFGNDAPWQPQDVIRFNTWGTLMPVWVLCAVQPSSTTPEGEDGYTMCLFGDTTEIKD